MRLIIIAIFINMFFIIPAHASSAEPVIVVREVDGLLSATTNNNPVTVPVLIQNNPGITSYKIRVNFDTNRLRFEGVDRGTVSQMRFDTNMQEYDESTGGSKLLTQAQIQKLTHVEILTYGESVIKTNGEMFRLHFSIIGGTSAKNGYAKVSLEYSPTSISGGSGINYDILPRDGGVRIISHDMTITGVNISKGTSVNPVASGSLSYSIRRTHSGAANRYVTALLAIYDSKKRCVYFAKKEDTLPSTVSLTNASGLYSSEFKNISFKSNPTESYTVKLFLWERDNVAASMSPFIPALSKTF